MQREQATLDLITRTFLVGGLALVFLVGAIAWVVTRQVVNPVRRAAVVAERLSSGRLNERMRARGEDDLARLAKSFNEMADSLQTPDPPARGPLPGPAAVRLRRLARAAHPADHHPDGRRPHPRLPRGLRPRGLALGRAAARRARPVRGAAGRPARDQPVRRRRGGARRRAGRPARRRRPGRASRAAAAGRALGQHRSRSRRRRPVRWPRSTPAGSSGSCATSWSTPSSTARAGRSRSRVAVDADAVAVTVRDHGVGLRPARPRWCSTASGGPTPPGRAPSVAPGWAWPSSLEDARLHDGWLQAWGEPGEGSLLPADPAAPRRHIDRRGAAAPAAGRRPRNAAAIRWLPPGLHGARRPLAPRGDHRGIPPPRREPR